MRSPTWASSTSRSVEACASRGTHALASRFEEACAASDPARTASEAASVPATTAIHGLLPVAGVSSVAGLVLIAGRRPILQASRVCSRVDDVPVVRINRWIADTGLEKRIVPLAAFAALAAMNGVVPNFDNGLHTRQRQLERHAKRRASTDDVGFRHRGIGG